MEGVCVRFQQLEAFFNGCRNECDQKCVIDNHEVEILQAPAIETPHGFADGFCGSGRATDLCTPRVRSQVYGEPQGRGYGSRSGSGIGFGSDRSHCSTPGRAAVERR
mmetsp:Transcript_85718/g.246034  ORF Transcript_85718/g.246034 Transcript_85718/m.246034 type:complete len:107 (+) Transcript_85718:94-414(+)|eukprot:CAMPEP_0177350770 /NCGR_PEP_ID=MMETSP0368-20130122/31497_2 /TAXON_ID=447022 ORGANISM="Scrippsiella hangoei-like, Strain SHHI-4" /NCGR_SAMPLE_ID=MMETSP0368 /ASSEMBLY_ACC=CAM_ASM_000363 /LENGTH=106 /DNA_ID=CAMNT_0018812713 /DNA_START=94 /DNA_END=414 /DNA_ORIENTATION=-